MRLYVSWFFTVSTLGLLLSAGACNGTNPPAATGSSSTSSSSSGAGGGSGEEGKLQAYAACSDSSECEDDLECIALLGSQVCAITGCAGDVTCPVGTTCVLSDAIHEAGICAYTGGSTFCARSCRDPLVCNIDPACTTAGCCGGLDANGCPTACAELEKMACEISPSCPASCCG